MIMHVLSKYKCYSNQLNINNLKNIIIPMDGLFMQSTRIGPFHLIHQELGNCWEIFCVFMTGAIIESFRVARSLVNRK